MASHVTHVGVHDHGFNNVTTYGNLLRLMREGRIDASEWERVLRAGAEGDRRGAGGALDRPARRPRLHLLVQRPALAVRRHHPLAARAGRGAPARPRADGRARPAASRCCSGCSSTPRPPRATTSTSATGRDTYDVRGRVAHESIFNVNDGAYRCPSSQQGYSPFTTWTRGLAWILLGYAEQLEFLATRARRGVRGVRREQDGGARPLPRGGARHRRLLHREHADGRRAVLGHRRARPRPARRLPRSPRRAVQRPRAGRQLRRRHRRPGADPPRHLPARPRRRTPPASATGGRPHRRRGRCSPSRTCRPTRSTRACCCTRSTTARTAGTTSRRAGRSPAASRACGATTTPASWRC